MMIQTIAAVLFAVFLVNLVKAVLRVRRILGTVKENRSEGNTRQSPRRFETGTATIEDADFVEVEPPHSRKG